jgi:hypothetical protein
MLECATTRTQLMFRSRLPDPPVNPDLVPAILERMSGYTHPDRDTPSSITSPNPTRFEHPDKAGHPHTNHHGHPTRSTHMT